MIAAALWVHPVVADAACPRALTQERLRVWQHEDGLPLDTVYALAQTPDGFLWVGTESGLARFDGVKFEAPDVSDTIGGSPDFIDSLAVGTGGSLYVGTGSSGVLELRGGALRPFAEPGWPHHPVEALLPGGDGRLWIGTRGGGLAVADRTGHTLYGESAGLAGPVVNDIAPRAAGGVWVGGGRGGVQWFDGARFHDLEDLEALAAVFVEAVHEDRAGRLWIGSREGLFRLAGGELEHFGADDGLGVAFIKDVTEDARGQIWVGTGGGGVARLRGDRFERLGEEEGLPIGQVEQVLEDREGSVWLATGGGGIVQLSTGAALPLTVREGLPPDPVLPILQTEEGTMWIGTFGGGLVRRSSCRTRVFGPDDGLSSPRILSLAEDPDGSLWIGTRAGLDHLRGDRIESFTEEDGLPHATVGSLFHDGDRLWVGTVDGLASIEGGEITTYPAPGGSYEGHVVALLEDRDGALWIGTEGGGLYRLRNGVVEADPLGSVLSSQMVFAFHEQADGVLWIATGAGVVRLGEAGTVHLTEADGLPDDQVFSFLEDGLGGLWMSSNRGVFRIDLEEVERFVDGEAETLTARRFDESDGMPRGETNGGFQPAAWRDREGRLWYPTSEGIAIFDPARVSAAGPPPEPVIRRITADGARLPLARGVAVPADPAWVEIAYTAPSFTDPAALEFQYRLRGFEEAWFSAGSARAALYRKLPPGRFVFDLRVRRPGGSWSSTRSAILSVDRRLVENPWFWLVCAAVAGAGASVVVRQGLRTRRRRRERLQQTQKLEAIGLLAGGVAHDFNNVLTAVLGYADLLSMSLPDDPAVQEELGEIRRAAERGAGLSRQLMAFGRQQPTEARWVDLAREVAGVETFLRRLIPETVRIETCLDPETGFCFIDPVQLEQVVLNLTLNAGDAMPEGGTVTLELTPVEDSHELRRAGADEETRHARLSVRDTGVGMDEATRRRIFEPFFTTKESGRGSGLGLAVTYGIVRQSGGSIDIDSAVGKGTTFHIYLPATREPGPEGAQDEAGEGPSGDRLNGSASGLP